MKLPVRFPAGAAAVLWAQGGLAQPNPYGPPPGPAQQIAVQVQIYNYARLG